MCPQVVTKELLPVGLPAVGRAQTPLRRRRRARTGAALRPTFPTSEGLLAARILARLVHTLGRGLLHRRCHLGTPAFPTGDLARKGSNRLVGAASSPHPADLPAVGARGHLLRDLVAVALGLHLGGLGGDHRLPCSPAARRSTVAWTPGTASTWWPTVSWRPTCAASGRRRSSGARSPCSPAASRSTWAAKWWQTAPWPSPGGRPGPPPGGRPSPPARLAAVAAAAVVWSQMGDGCFTQCQNCHPRRRFRGHPRFMRVPHFPSP